MLTTDELRFTLAFIGLNLDNLGLNSSFKIFIFIFVF